MLEAGNRAWISGWNRLTMNHDKPCARCDENGSKDSRDKLGAISRRLCRLSNATHRRSQHLVFRHGRADANG